MPLGKGIAEVFGAIPDRIEVSGHEPTWKVTGGSFESVLAFAREAYGETTVVAREDRSRWWPRVTLTVTRDPALAANAPDLATFATPAVPKQAARRRATPVTEDTPSFVSALDEIFAHQEELRLARRGIPQQRASS
jgi:hypothetical protein